MNRFLATCVGEYMSAAVVSVGPETTLEILEEHFARHDFNAFAYSSRGLLVGTVTKFDVLEALTVREPRQMERYEDIARMPARET